MNKKKIVICYVIFVLILIISLPFLLIFAKNKQQEKLVISAMETWAKGEEYKGTEVPYWFDVENKKSVEKKAAKIVRELKSDPENMIYFLNQLEDHWYKDIDLIEKELQDLDCSFDEKLQLASYQAKHGGVFYYDLPQVTKTELMNYINKTGQNKLHMEKGTGGYYDSKEDYYNRDEVGLKGSPIYDSNSIEYYGDFKTERSYGVRLDKYYQEESYSYSSHYYKEYQIYFYPLNSECYLSGDYLFAFFNGEIHVLNVTNGEYYEFD